MRRLKKTLEQIVDDYLVKHEACVQAGYRRSRALQEVWPEERKDEALEAFVKAHNDRAEAFRVLCDARQITRIK